jgi:hypothetical protein
LYSKRKTGAWPNVEKVAKMIHEYFTECDKGGDTSKFDMKILKKKTFEEHTASPKKVTKNMKKTFSTTLINGN